MYLAVIEYLLQEIFIITTFKLHSIQLIKIEIRQSIVNF